MAGDTNRQESFAIAWAADERGLDVDMLTAVLEGLLFASGTEGLNDQQIARVFGIGQEQVAVWCETLAARLADSGRFLRVVRIADAWQLVTAPALRPYLEALALAPPPSPLTPAALEVLAIIAYRQPITRPAIEDIRGVKSERPLGTLLARGLIHEVGRVEGPGRPILYGTTKEFLDHFGLSSPADLPPLPEKVAD